MILGRQSSMAGVWAASARAVMTGSITSTPPGACGLGLATPTTSTVVSSGSVSTWAIVGLVPDDDLGSAGAVAHDEERQAGETAAAVHPAVEANGVAGPVGVRRERRT